MATRLSTIKDIRLKKLQELKQKGINPFPPNFERSHTISEARNLSGKFVSIAGRIVALREHGKIVFGDISDESGKIQMLLRPDDLGEGFSLIESLDLGDFIGVSGEIVTTRTGEITVQVKEIKLLSKAIRPLPSMWHGLKDVDERFRKRYLDTLLNPEVKKLLDTRWKIEQETRKYLWGLGFVEVETPVLQPLYGGTNARPFNTHMNALDQDFYLRVAPELYLKRLIVGGYEKVFEIARNFRNEGIDTTHQPEFTMMEWYEAYADYQRVMDVAEGLMKHLVTATTGTAKIKVGDHEVDLSGKWPRISMVKLVKQHLDIDYEVVTDNELKDLLKKNNLKAEGVWSKGLAFFTLFDHLVSHKLVEPTWVIDYPKEVSPLSKQHRDDDRFVERFEGYIGGREIFDGWSEINDPLDQRARFENEQKNLKAGNDEAQPTDEDFLEALEYGMPPLGGIGIGIDRLVMFLTNTWSIRETIAFPTLKLKN